MTGTATTAAAASGRPLIELRGVTVGYDRGAVLVDADLSVRAGDFLAVIGPNGGGKTTLLRVILGLLEPWRGSVRRHVVRRRGAMGYVPQHAVFDRSFPLRVRDAVLMGRLGLRGPLHRYTVADRQAVEAVLARLGLDAVADANVGDLSGGQVQRTLIARAMVGEPEVLFLDEPLASVDPEYRGRLVDDLAAIQRSIPVVVVTHDLTPYSALVRQVACVNRRLFYHPHGELSAEALEEAYGCPVELVAHGVPHRVLADHRQGHGHGAGHDHGHGHDHGRAGGDGG